MKISYALVALVAMLCMAGMASAQTPVQGTVGAAKSVPIPTATVDFGAMSPLTSPANAVLTVTGNANVPVSITATSTGLVPSMATLMTIDGNVCTTGSTQVITPTGGVITANFALSQEVAWADGTGSHSGTIIVTIT